MHRENLRYDSEGKAAFVMNVVRGAEMARDDFLPRWEESWANYLVLPLGDVSYHGRTDDPLSRSNSYAFPRRAGRALIKDPESHQVVESLLAETLTQLFPDDGFVKAKPTGGEDYKLGEGANRIIEGVMSKSRHRRVVYQWLKDTFIVGTGIVFGDWEFEEDFEIARIVAEEGALSASAFTRQLVTVADDVRLENVDIMDFYPVPGEDTFDDLKGAVRKVDLYTEALLTEAKEASPSAGWYPDILAEAASMGYEGPATQWEDFKTDLYQDSQDYPMSDFKPVTAYEYWGEVPWAGTDDDPIEDGAKRRRLLVVNGKVVREQDWPLKRKRLPFFDITINPMTGRLYGLSPLEVIRFDQDFADVLKQMLATAVVRSVNPPHVINTQMGVSPAKVAAFRSDVPITADGDVRQAFAQAPYAPPIQQAQSIQMDIRENMRGGAGARGGVQGEGLGSKRFSASEASTQYRAQFARPNMIAQMIEQVSLPPLGCWVIDMYSLHIEDSATLLERFGEDFPIGLSDLQPKHDVRFVGGRREHDKISKASAMERFLAVVAQVPEIRAQVPWDEFLKIYTKAIDLPDLVALIGNDEVLANNMGMQAFLSQQGMADGGRSGVSGPAGPASDVELAGSEIQ